MKIKELTHDELETIVRAIAQEVFFQEEISDNFDTFIKKEKELTIVNVCDKAHWRMPFKDDVPLNEFKGCLKSFFYSAKDEVVYGKN